MSHPARHEPLAEARPARVDAVDLLRGVVMILMALDHARDYFGDAAANPTDLATASAALFLTRWVTHLCAPVFSLLTGVGAYLSRRRRTPAELSRYLLERGLLLVVLDPTLFRFLVQFNVDYRVTVLNVIWVLGWSMVALAGLVRLPTAVVATIGVAMIALHDLADGVAPATFGALAPLWVALHQPGFLVNTPRVVVLVAYPLVPWIGVMAVGYALGAVIGWPPERRRRLLWRIGAGLTVAFVLLRALNGYGDPQRWAPQPTAAFTALSFVNTTKYPPSLLFLLMTLGPALLLLAAADVALDGQRRDRTRRALEAALVFGRVPLFYFLLHFTLLHLMAVVASAARYGTIRPMVESPNLGRFPVTQPPGWPSSLPWVYAAWIAVVLLAYPCCRWYGALKARRPDSWLRFL